MAKKFHNLTYNDLKAYSQHTNVRPSTGQVLWGIVENAYGGSNDIAADGNWQWLLNAIDVYWGKPALTVNADVTSISAPTIATTSDLMRFIGQLASSLNKAHQRIAALEADHSGVTPTKITISNISVGSTNIADGSSMNITFKTSASASISLVTSSGTGWKATVTSSAGTNHTVKVENLTGVTTSGTIAANTIKVIANPSDTTNYSSSDSTSIQTSAITLAAKPAEPTKVQITNVSMGATTIADGSSMNITFKTNTTATVAISSGASGTGWKANVTSSAGTNHTVKVENLTSTSAAGSISANTIKVTATPSDTTNYLTSDATSIQSSAITLSAAVPSTTYYYYVGRQPVSGGIGTTDYMNTNTSGFLASSSKIAKTSIADVKSAVTGLINIGSIADGDAILILPTEVANSITSIKNPIDFDITYDMTSPVNGYVCVFIGDYTGTEIKVAF